MADQPTRRTHACSITTDAKRGGARLEGETHFGGHGRHPYLDFSGIMIRQCDSVVGPRSY